LLRSFLTRRGLALSTAALTAALTQTAVSAAPPAALVAATVKHAALAATGPAVAAAIPPQIAVLVTGVLRTMRFTNFRKRLLAALAVVVLVGVGLVWHQHRGGITAAEPVAALDAPNPSPAPSQGKKDPAKKDLELLQGMWTVSAMEFGGQAVPAESLARYR